MCFVFCVLKPLIPTSKNLLYYPYFTKLTYLVLAIISQAYLIYKPISISTLTIGDIILCTFFVLAV